MCVYMCVYMYECVDTHGCVHALGLERTVPVRALYTLVGAGYVYSFM